MSRTNFHGPKDVSAIKVRLYEQNSLILDSAWTNQFAGNILEGESSDLVIQSAHGQEYMETIYYMTIH